MMSSQGCGPLGENKDQDHQQPPWSSASRRCNRTSSCSGYPPEFPEAQLPAIQMPQMASGRLCAVVKCQPTSLLKKFSISNKTLWNKYQYITWVNHYSHSFLGIRPRGKSVPATMGCVVSPLKLKSSSPNSPVWLCLETGPCGSRGWGNPD